MLRRFAAYLTAVLVLGVAGSTPLVAAEEEPAFTPPAWISISAPRGMSLSLSTAALTGAADNGARATLIQQGTLDLVGRRHDGTLVWSTAPGWSVPWSAQAMEPFTASELLSPVVGETLARGEVVLGETSARLRGAVVGDQLDVIGWHGHRLSLTVGAIVPDAQAFSSEVLMSRELADALGFRRPERVVAWAFGDAAAFEAALVTRLPTNQTWKLRRSWDEPSPDGVLSQARLKETLGEFAVARTRTGIRLEPRWVEANIARESLPIIGTFTCHRTMLTALRAALTEVSDSGLAGAIDVRDSRRYGGCFGGRELRTDSGNSGRNLSRHSWGAAIDLNPSSNGFGRTPHMDVRVVEIFRRHGFAWGGSFTIPDGMHFEYIGNVNTGGDPGAEAPSTVSSPPGADLRQPHPAVSTV